MRARGLILLLAVVLASPALAEEDEDDRVVEAPPVGDVGPFAALRAGLGGPWGDIADGGPRVSDYADAKLPLGFELGYRLGRRLWTELYFELAPARAARALCAGGAACSASDVRLGLAAIVRLAPGARLDPWVALGAGIEVMNAKGRDAATGEITAVSWAGVEAPVLEAGLDVALSDYAGVGPWLSASLSHFTTGSARDAEGDTSAGRIEARGRHGWISGGVKLTLRL